MLLLAFESSWHMNAMIIPLCAIAESKLCDYGGSSSSPFPHLFTMNISPETEGI